MADSSAGIALPDNEGASQPRRTFEPIARNRPSKGTGPRFKIVVFNAKGGKHLDAIVDHLSRPPLAGAAVILLCELDWRLKRSGMSEVASELAERLSMSFAFAPEFGFPRRDGITSFLGNAILSSEPLFEVKAVPITPLYDWTRRHPGGIRDVRAIGARNALIATINLSRTRITLGVIHLERLTGPRGRASLIVELLAAIPRSGCAIVGGDFNSATANLRGPLQFARLAVQMLREPRRLRRPEIHEPLFDELKRAGFTLDSANAPLAPTFKLFTAMPRFMRPKLDWIAVRNVRPVPGSACVVQATRSFGRSASDHDFIACEVEL